MAATVGEGEHLCVPTIAQERAWQSQYEGRAAQPLLANEHGKHHAHHRSHHVHNQQHHDVTVGAVASGVASAVVGVVKGVGGILAGIAVHTGADHKRHHHGTHTHRNRSKQQGVHLDLDRADFTDDDDTERVMRLIEEQEQSERATRLIGQQEHSERSTRLIAEQELLKEQSERVMRLIEEQEQSERMMRIEEQEQRAKAQERSDCSVCFGVCRVPRTLPCGHAQCRGCFQQLKDIGRCARHPRYRIQRTMPLTPCVAFSRPGAIGICALCARPGDDAQSPLVEAVILTKRASRDRDPASHVQLLAKGEALARAAADAAPTDGMVHHVLGIVLAAKGDHDGAIAAQRRAVGCSEASTASCSAVAHGKLGRLLCAKGDALGADASFRAAIHAEQRQSALFVGPTGLLYGVV